MTDLGKVARSMQLNRATPASKFLCVQTDKGGAG